MPVRIFPLHQQANSSSATGNKPALLSLAFLALPLAKYSSSPHRTKRSIPKWILPNPALVDPDISAKGNREFIFENLVGSHLANLIFGRQKYSLQYWREDNQEIDFILCRDGQATLAIEAKSGRLKRIPTSETLTKRGIKCPLLVVHPGNLEKFLFTTSMDAIEELQKQ